MLVVLVVGGMGLMGFRGGGYWGRIDNVRLEGREGLGVSGDEVLNSCDRPSRKEGKPGAGVGVAMVKA